MFELGKQKVRAFSENNFYPSTYLDKGCWNAHPFPQVWEKFLQKFFTETSIPSLICTSSPKCTPKISSSKEMFTKNSHVLLSGKYLSLYLFGIESRFDTLFQINFLKKFKTTKKDHLPGTHFCATSKWSYEFYFGYEKKFYSYSELYYKFIFLSMILNQDFSDSF